MKRWTKETIIEEIKQMSSRDEPLASGHVHRHHHRMWLAAKKIFGDWYAAVDAAGIDAAKIREKAHQTIKANLERGRTPEAHKNRAQNRVGKKYSPAHRAALSEAAKRSEKSRAHLKRIRDEQNSKPKDDKFRLATSIGHREHAVGAETKSKIGAASKGRVRSQESIERGRKRLTREIADEIRRLYDTKEYTQPQLADRFGISKAHVHNIVTWKVWRN